MREIPSTSSAMPQFAKSPSRCWLSDQTPSRHKSSNSFSRNTVTRRRRSRSMGRSSVMTRSYWFASAVMASGPCPAVGPMSMSRRAGRLSGRSSRNRAIKRGPCACWPFMTAIILGMGIPHSRSTSINCSSNASCWTGLQRRSRLMAKPTPQRFFERANCPLYRSRASRQARWPGSLSCTPTHTGQPTSIDPWYPKADPSPDFGRGGGARLRAGVRGAPPTPAYAPARRSSCG